ncbi:MAG TPA: hypothetical protein VGG68_07150 [Caulobacteraceae bacterium]|jgi:hypothetical protein
MICCTKIAVRAGNAKTHPFDLLKARSGQAEAYPAFLKECAHSVEVKPLSRATMVRRVWAIVRIGLAQQDLGFGEDLFGVLWSWQTEMD